MSLFAPEQALPAVYGEDTRIPQRMLRDAGILDMMMIVIHIVVWNGPSVMPSQIDDTLKRHRVRRWWRARSQLFRIGAVILAIPVVIVIAVVGFLGVHQALQPDPPPPVPQTAEGYQIPYDHLDGAYLSQWSDYKIIDDTHIAIEFGMSDVRDGHEVDCFRHVVKVEKSDTAITISMYTRNMADKYEYCRFESRTMMQMAWTGYYVLVDVGSPIHGREVVDGGR
jgi:hypothetical protein